MNEAVAHFDGKTLSYVYENGWEFTNFFHGTLRVSQMEKRGELRETIEFSKLSKDSYLLAWVDEEMGPITQLVDFATKVIWATVFYEGKMQIWPGKIIDFSPFEK